MAHRMNPVGSPSRLRAALGGLAAAALLLAACSSGSSSAAEVASLAGDDTSADGAATDDAAVDAPPVDDQQAALDFAQCMRDNGVDVADPTFDADGNLDGGLFGPDSGIEPGSTDVRAAMDACGDLLEGIAFGPGGGRGFDRDAIEAALLDFSECLRDEGLDVGDVELGGPGGGGPPSAGEPGDGPTAGDTDGEGRPQGGPGGDPTARMIEALGLDPDDDAVIAAMETCRPILEGAFQGGPAANATEE